jgi:NAD(P)-dependent dehydrogenase (short-subunit alcohol dehydrogenase family)
MQQRYQGKTAIITGAGRNVGAAIAHRLADEGARVAVVDLDEGRGTAVAREINDQHPDAAQWFSCDVSDSEQVQKLVTDVVAAFGTVDVLVNNVAITDRGATVLELEEDTWHRVLAVCTDSVFLCSKYVGRQMVAAGNGGAIVNIGSTSGYRARVNATAYAAAKAAVLSLSRSTAAQLGQHGIRVNTVVPNKVGSPVGQDVEPEDRERKNVLNRGAVPADIANAVAFVASDEAGFMTAADILVDGGSLYAGS